MKAIWLAILVAIVCAGCSNSESDVSSDDIRAVAEWVVMQHRLSVEVVDRLENQSEQYVSDDDASLSDMLMDIEMAVRGMHEECKKGRLRTERMRPDFQSPTTLAALDDFVRTFEEVEEELAGCVSLMEEIDGDVLRFVRHSYEIERAMMQLKHVSGSLLDTEVQQAAVIAAAERLLVMGQSVQPN